MARPYIPVEIDRRVRNSARNRCGYCLSPQHLVMARLERVRLKLTKFLSQFSSYKYLSSLCENSIMY